MRSGRNIALILGAFVLLLGGMIESARAQGAAHKEFKPGALQRVEDLPASRLRTQLERLPDGAKQRAVAWLANFHFTEHDLESLHVDTSGGIFYADEFKLEPAPVAQAEPETANASVPVSPYPANLIFHSKPGAPNVIYLNFTGETVANTAWNTSINRTSIPALAFSSDSDRTTFSDSEQLAIKRIWQRVAEDYAPFNVDVTTERPATFNNRIAHALITRNTDANGAANPASTAGGVAYVGVFGNASYATYRPAWIYHNNLANEESYIAEAVSHEIGHNLGLSHDGRTDGQDYYGGHGSGETSWGPIMGTGYNRNVSQWSKGEYYLANNTQDDLATIAGKLSYRVDDHGSSLSAASPLTIAAGGVVASTTLEDDPSNLSPANKGVIERNTDSDWFSFSSGNGPLSLTINPWIVASASTRGGNVDVVAELYDSAGRLLLTNNATASTRAVIQTNLSEGVYYLAIRPAGVGTPLSSSPSGYTTYGSVGEYFISGSLVPSGAVIPPGAEVAVTDINQAGAGPHQLRVTYRDNVGIDVSSVDAADLRVTSASGSSLAVTLVSIDQITDGTPRVATYAVSPPGAFWTEQENGIYTVSVVADQVSDTEGEFVPARDLGQFTVAVPRVIFSQKMDTNPGWTFQGAWEWGAPRYSILSILSAPTRGYTGTNIIGYNLGGNYENRLAPTYAATPVINCAGSSSLTLRFRRWLRIRNGDTANIQVSADGVNWTDVWTTTRSVTDAAWQEVQYSLPASILGSSTVRLRWGLASNNSQNDIGWNIDDVEILGNGALDTALPNATLDAPNIVSGGSPVYTFSVTYTDNVGISVASLGAADLYVLGPNGYSNVVEFAGVDVPTDGTPRVATYTVNSPAEVWASEHNGSYQVYLRAGEVTDTSNNSFDEAQLGGFAVAISENQPPIVSLVANRTSVAAGPVNLTLSAQASDDGGVSKVEFFQDNVSVGIDTLNPYELAIPTLAPGIYTFACVATDDGGLATTSASVQVRVAMEPKITSISRTEVSCTISASATTGITHDLEATVDFANWAVVASAIAADDTVTFTNVPAAAPPFFRVVAR